MQRLNNIGICWILFVCMLTTNTTAQILWDGESVDGLWSSPKNWVGDVLPDGNSNVEIDGIFFVTMDDNTTVNSVVLSGEARLLIDDGKQLTLSGIMDQAIMIDNALLEIKGTLYIDLFLGDGIKNINGGHINNQGHIIVDLVTGDGIWNEAGINNTGCIHIDSTQENGIVNTGAAANFENSDSIKIFRLAESGLQNLSGAMFSNKTDRSHLELKLIYGVYALRNNTSTFQNYGALRMDSTANTGISSLGINGLFENHSFIHVSNALGGSSIGNSLGCPTINKTNGRISIEHANGGINNSIGGTWVNEGAIDIKNVSTGLNNYSCFMNKDSISIDSAQIGIYNLDSTFYNTSTGVIEISHIDGTSASWGIYNIRDFDNYGEIILSDIRTGIRNHTSLCHFDNFHILHISQVMLYGIWNTNSGSLIDHPTASIDVVGSRIGIRNEFINSCLINMGQIEVDGASEIAIFCTESTSIVNESNGEISVTNTLEGPISIESPATLENNGLLDLE
ncbi:MAG: hypothetical protein HKN87_02770 [Saprospiraceae bacterium]|nr:hypothetical protein [Saprospiraceae bacterium]